jgi:flagellar protein FlaI
VRRNKSISEVVQYDSENDEIVVQDVYRWQAETDSFLRPGNSNLIEEIKFDRGWTEDELQREINERKVILSYLIVQGLNKYRQVAATFQAYMTDKQTVLTLIAENRLEESLNNLREMESVEVYVDPENQERTPMPNPDEDLNELCHNILEENKEWLEEYVGLDVSIEESLSTHHPQTDNSEIDTEDIKAIAGETLETDVEDSSIDDILEEIDQRKPDEQKFEVVDQKENSDE